MATGSEQRRCGGCAHFKRMGGEAGQCRESSPQVVVLHRMRRAPLASVQPSVEEYLDSAWPPVLVTTESCSRWRERPEDEPELTIEEDPKTVAKRLDA